MPQCVAGGNSGAEQGRCIDVAQTGEYRHQRFDESHHVSLLSAVITDARDFQITAIAKVSPPALGTSVILAAVPAHADAASGPYLQQTLNRLPSADMRTVIHVQHFAGYVNGFGQINNSLSNVPGLGDCSHC